MEIQENTGLSSRELPWSTFPDGFPLPSLGEVLENTTSRPGRPLGLSSHLVENISPFH